MSESMLKRLVIVGAGAVGGSVGGMLYQSGFPVTLVARGGHGKAIRDNGLRVRMANQTIVAGVDCVESIPDVSFQPGDVAMVATKLNDAEQVLETLLQHAGPQLPVVCASNGVHGERWAAARFTHVVSMLVWTPATYLSPGEISIYSEGCPAVLDCGCFVDTVNGLHYSEEVMAISGLLCTRLGKAGFAAESRADMQRWKYAKWITNLGNTSQALVEDDWKSCAQAAQAEGEWVLDKAGYDRVTVKELIDRGRVVKAAPIEGEQRPGGSTWQSFKRGRPLESIWLEGAMADLADEVGVVAPINRFLARVSMSPRPLKAAEVLAHSAAIETDETNKS